LSKLSPVHACTSHITSFLEVFQPKFYEFSCYTNFIIPDTPTLTRQYYRAACTTEMNRNLEKLLCTNCQVKNIIKLHISEVSKNIIFKI